MRRRSLLAAGAGGLATAALGLSTPAFASAGQTRIALVPLDDRPVNTYCPEMTAASAEVTLEPEIGLSQ